MKHEWIEMFRAEIREMKYGSPLYQMVKEELAARGNWRHRKRGKPMPDNLKGRQLIQKDRVN